MAEIVILPWISELHRKQTPLEAKLLAESIEKFGVHDPVIVTPIDGQQVIVDGEHRYREAEKKGVDCPIREIYFAGNIENGIREYVRSKQLGRRNLGDAEYKLALGREYNATKGDRSYNLKEGSKKSPKVQSASSGETPIKQGSTAESIAAEEGVSKDTVKRAGKLAEAYDKLIPEMQELVEGGAIHGQLEMSVAASLSPEQQEGVANRMHIGQGFTQAVEGVTGAPAKVRKPNKPRKKPARKPKGSLAQQKKEAKALLKSHNGGYKRAVGDLHELLPKPELREKMQALLTELFHLGESW